MKLTEQEKIHLTHYYWERHRHYHGPANQWNEENEIADYDLLVLTRQWVQETKAFHIREPKEPWVPPAKNGRALQDRIRPLEDAAQAGIRPDTELRAKMFEVEERVRRRLGRRDLFSWVVHVYHLDGSTMIYHNAGARRWEGYLFVWTEHNGTHPFYVGDLAGYAMYEQVTIPRAR